MANGTGHPTTTAGGAGRSDDALQRAVYALNNQNPNEAQRIAGDTGIAEQRLVNEEDPYYYSRQRRRFEEVVLPVYRVILNDDDQTRYYLDPNTGALVQRADATGRWRRWLFSGLHRLDFTDWMRTRPLRDIMMWLTLLGGLGVSVTGVYLAIRRIRSDVTLLVRFIVRPRAAAKSISRETEMIDA